MSGKLTAERKRPGKAIAEHQPEKRRAENREKIEINPKEPRYLKVVWGVGYKIEKQ